MQRSNNPTSPKLSSKNFNLLCTNTNKASTPHHYSSKHPHNDTKHDTYVVRSPPIKEFDLSARKKHKEIISKTPVSMEKRFSKQEPNHQSIYNYLMRQKTKLGLDSRTPEKRDQTSQSVNMSSMGGASQKQSNTVQSQFRTEESETETHVIVRDHERSTATTTNTNLSSRSTEDEEDGNTSLARQKRAAKIATSSAHHGQLGQQVSSNSNNWPSPVHKEGQYRPVGGTPVVERGVKSRERVETMESRSREYSSDEIRSRKKDLLKIHEEMTGKSDGVPQLAEIVKDKKRKLDENYRKVEEGVEKFAEEVVKAVRLHTEKYMQSVREHYKKDSAKIERLVERVEDYSEEICGMKEDIEANFYKIVSMTDQRLYKTIVDDYVHKNKEFVVLSEKVREIGAQARVPASEELAYYKKTLRELLESAVGSSRFEGDLNMERMKAVVKDDVESSMMMGKKQKSLPKAMLQRELKKPVNLEDGDLLSSPVLISFENREIFENAVQMANQKASVGLSLKLDLMNQVNSQPNLFKIDMDGLGEVNCGDPRRTPRLNFELKEQVSEDINEMRHDENRGQVKKGLGTKGFEAVDSRNSRGEMARRVKTEYDDDTDFLQYLEPKGGVANSQNPFRSPVMVGKR